MLRPVSPFVEYVINYNYISEVLCVNKDKPELKCNGKCHLMKELKKQQDDDFKSLRISMKDYPIGFVELFSMKTKKTEQKLLEKPIFYQQSYSYIADSSVFHPPNYFHFISVS